MTNISQVFFVAKKCLNAILCKQLLLCSRPAGERCFPRFNGKGWAKECVAKQKASALEGFRDDLTEWIWINLAVFLQNSWDDTVIWFCQINLILGYDTSKIDILQTDQQTTTSTSTPLNMYIFSTKLVAFKIYFIWSMRETPKRMRHMSPVSKRRKIPSSFKVSTWGRIPIHGKLLYG